MRVTFYGVRGSHPMARKNLIGYGGNTSCVHFSSPGGEDLILDCGSGIRALGKEMMTREFGRGEGKAHILLGHTHWDHILGLPFFEPLYRAGNEFTIVSAPQDGVHILSRRCQDCYANDNDGGSRWAHTLSKPLPVRRRTIFSNCRTDKHFKALFSPRAAGRLLSQGAGGIY